jgi:hypothetical protein
VLLPASAGFRQPVRVGGERFPSERKGSLFQNFSVVRSLVPTEEFPHASVIICNRCDGF